MKVWQTSWALITSNQRTKPIRAQRQNMSGLGWFDSGVHPKGTFPDVWCGDITHTYAWLYLRHVQRLFYGRMVWRHSHTGHHLRHVKGCSMDGWCGVLTHTYANTHDLTWGIFKSSTKMTPLLPTGGPYTPLRLLSSLPSMISCGCGKTIAHRIYIFKYGSLRFLVNNVSLVHRTHTHSFSTQDTHTASLHRTHTASL